jgi:hypothetical protein
MTRAPKRPAKLPPLWACPSCGARFTTRNSPHSCGTYDLDALFARSRPFVRRLYDRFLAIVRESGPVTVIPQKTRIALQVRMRFAALMPRKEDLKGHLVLARRHPSDRFERIDTYSPCSHVHVFRLRSADELDTGFRALIGEAYRVGRQEHLACRLRSACSRTPRRVPPSRSADALEIAARDRERERELEAERGSQLE